MKGVVYLVGAGPGDAGLITLRGAELLGMADVVIHDGLVNPALLRLARPGAEIIYGGKHGPGPAVSQAELNRLLVERAAAGSNVVRLKAGDPYVFGRGAEEAECLAAASLPFEVVPGVSSAEAVPGYAGIPLTHRDYCSSYTVVTGHENPARGEERLDWAALAQIPGTLVVLMGLKRLRQIADSLMAHGRAPSTPVALIRCGTTWQQQVAEGTLATIAGLAEQANLQPPVVTVIGEVVRLRSKLDWFGRRPLLGQRIVVTQPREVAGPLSRRLHDLGAEVLEVPAFAFMPPADPAPLRRALARTAEFDWIIFSSPQSVEAFVKAFFEKHRDWRELGGVRLAAYGPQTAAALRALHLHVNAEPAEHLGPQIAAALAEHGPLRGARILMLRPAGASRKVPDCIESHGAGVQDLACYRTDVDRSDPAGMERRLRAEGANWITFAGYPDVNYFNARVDLRELTRRFPGLRLATIGPKTSQLLVNLGLQPSAEAGVPTPDALIEALIRARK